MKILFAQIHEPCKLQCRLSLPGKTKNIFSIGWETQLPGAVNTVTVGRITPNHGQPFGIPVDNPLGFIKDENCGNVEGVTIGQGTVGLDWDFIHPERSETMSHSWG